MADDDPDDCLLAEHALEVSGIPGTLRCVEDGEELLDYLLGRGRFKDGGHTAPSVILLDLNMPKVDGREALMEIRSVPRFKDLPIIVFTTSREEKDIDFSRKNGATELITKPPVFNEWVEIMKLLAKKWLK